MVSLREVVTTFCFLPAVVSCAAPGSSARPVAIVDEAIAASRVAEVFAPGTISDSAEQWRITFTPDGRTAYFASSEKFFPFTRQATIFFSNFVDGAWTKPSVAPFSGEFSDTDPFISPDGRTLYFSSIRPVDGAARGDIDLWKVESTGQGWGQPIRLGPEVNSPDDELYPSLSADGTIYFASGPQFPQPGKHFDIYAAERNGSGFAERRALGSAVNTVPAVEHSHLQHAWEFNPEISPDGKTLVFTSLRPGGAGRGDLYVSNRVNGDWSPARNLGPLVNTARDEYHPTLSRSGRSLYFIRRGPADGNFYHIATEALYSLRVPAGSR